LRATRPAPEVQLTSALRRARDVPPPGRHLGSGPSRCTGGSHAAMRRALDASRSGLRLHSPDQIEPPGGSVAPDNPLLAGAKPVRHSQLTGATGECPGPCRYTVPVKRRKGAAASRCRSLDGRAAILMVFPRPGGFQVRSSSIPCDTLFCVDERSPAFNLPSSSAPKSGAYGQTF
jgi:hypothetical protein